MNNDNTKEFERKLKSVKAKDLMSRFAITIKEDETITTLAHLIMRFKISGVPVQAKNGDIHGIITATDLFNLMEKIVEEMGKGQNIDHYKEIKVGTLMSHDVVTITEDTSLYDMIKIMYDRNIHTLPVMVIAKNEIVGVIGRRDILNAFYVGVSGELK